MQSIMEAGGVDSPTLITMAPIDIHGSDSQLSSRQNSSSTTVQWELFAGENFREFRGFGAIRKSYNYANFHGARGASLSMGVSLLSTIAKVQGSWISLSLARQYFSNSGFPSCHVDMVASTIGRHFIALQLTHLVPANSILSVASCVGIIVVSPESAKVSIVKI